MTQTNGDLFEAVSSQAQTAKAAARVLSTLSTAQKNEVLLAMGDALLSSANQILLANELDVQDAISNGQSDSRIDRLRLSHKRIEEMVSGLKQVVHLPDPVGERLSTRKRQNGLVIDQIRVPLGVVAMIYESRPNVTVDAAGLTLKTGNAVVLRGGKEALRTNSILVESLRKGLTQQGLPEGAIGFIDRPERETVDMLIRMRGLIDLAIPRGGAGLISTVVERALVPVIETGVGNCHVYVDRDADFQKATSIVINAKTQRPSVCNAIETLLVHESIASAFLPLIAADLIAKSVEIRGCEKTLAILQTLFNLHRDHIVPAQDEDFETEFSDLVLAIKVVHDEKEAIDHIDRYGTRHSEAIVSENMVAAEEFLQQVDAAAVYHNASTRFTDGFEFGFGAEIGISTQKLHARGPMGLEALTSYKYVIRGDGQIRG